MPKFCVQALVSSVPGSMMNVLPCFVELGRPLDVLPAGQGRASTRFPRAQQAQQAQQAQRAHTQSTSTGIAGAVLGGLAIRSFGNRRPLRSLPKLTARVSILDIPDIPTEVDGDSCTPPLEIDGRGWDCRWGAGRSRWSRLRHEFGRKKSSRMPQRSQASCNAWASIS